VEVELISATALADDTKSKILDKVKSDYKNASFEINEIIDPTILGGFIVKIGDKQLDSSVASQLTNLKNILLN
jgi:F-type H+-transporting ATPase subunit delta